MIQYLTLTQPTNKDLPLGLFKYHVGSFGGVAASRMEIVLDGISPSSFEASPWSFPAMDIWFEVINSSYREGGWHAGEVSEPA